MLLLFVSDREKSQPSRGYNRDKKEQDLLKRTTLFILTAIAVVFFAACGRSVATSPANNANTKAAQPNAVAPTADALLAFDKQANEAYFKGDAKFFEDMLSDKFVRFGPGSLRMGKAANTRMIAGVKCDIKEWKLDEQHMSTVDADTYVLSYKGTFNGTCTMDEETQKVPSPARFATVWIRSGDKWQAAFHGANPIVDPSATAAPSAKPEVKKEAPARDDKSRLAVKPAAPAADPITGALVAIEKSIWEAWMLRDAKKLEELTAPDVTFVDIFGNVTSTKAETIKFWAEHKCDIKSVSVTDGKGTPLSATVAILTHKGMAQGTCGGQKLPPIYGTSVYAKNGDAWRLAFTLNRLP